MRERNLLAVTDVFIVDPQPLLCAALSIALEDEGDLKVAGWSCDEMEAVDHLSRQQVDVVITAVSLRDGSGLSLIRRLRDSVPAILLVPDGDVRLVSEAVAAGAAGCLSRECDLVTLAKCATDVSSGLFAIEREHLRATFRYLAAPPKALQFEVKLSRLTGREREVLQLLAEALDNETIGAQLHLSSNTIRTHIGNILRKLEMHSRAEAVHHYLTAGSEEETAEIVRIIGPDLG